MKTTCTVFYVLKGRGQVTVLTKLRGWGLGQVEDFRAPKRARL